MLSVRAKWRLRLAKIKWIVSQFPFLGKRIFPYGPAFLQKGVAQNSTFGEKFCRVKNRKIIAVGLPKSGNNWLGFLLADCLDMPQVDPWEGINKSGITHTHEKVSHGIIFRKDIVRVVYLMRDIRDIVVSYYYYSQTEYFKNIVDPSCFCDDIESFYFEYFLTRYMPIHRVVNHAESYIERRVPLIKYEALWDDPMKQLQRLFLRWGIKVEKEKIQYAINNNSIEKLSKTGKKSWEQIPPTHFRKGGHGGYKNILPKKVIEDINYRFGDYLRRWGYVLDK